MSETLNVPETPETEAPSFRAAMDELEGIL